MTNLNLELDRFIEEDVRAWIERRKEELDQLDFCEISEEDF